VSTRTQEVRSFTEHLGHDDRVQSPSTGFIIPDDEDHSVARSTVNLLVERRSRRSQCLEGERGKENHSGHKWELLHMCVLNQRELVHICLHEPFGFGAEQKLCLQEGVDYHSTLW